MSNDATPREAIARAMFLAIGQENDNDDHAIDIHWQHWKDDHLADADAVIAHLWQAASDPEVVEAVARFVIHGWDDYTPDGPLQEGARNMAKGEIAELLTLLIGPPPTNG